MIQTTIKRQTAYYTLSLLFWHEILFKYFIFEVFGLFLDFYGYLYISPLEHFLSVQTLATTDVKLYRRTNAPTSGFFTAQTSKDFPFTSSVEAMKSPKLQMKVLLSALKMILFFLLKLFNVNDLESDNSEEKNYKLESVPNEINLHK